MSIRENIINELKAIIVASTKFNTVKVVNTIDNEYPIDLADSDLPAIKILAKGSDIQYNKGKVSYNKIIVELYTYVVEWNPETVSTEEDVLKNLMDIFGDKCTINGKATDISIKTIIKQQLAYPLLSFNLIAEIGHEAEIMNN